MKTLNTIYGIIKVFLLGIALFIFALAVLLGVNFMEKDNERDVTEF